VCLPVEGSDRSNIARVLSSGDSCCDQRLRSRSQSVDGTVKDGKATHDEWTGKFDGKGYPVTCNPNTDERSLTKIGGRTLVLKAKKHGKVFTTFGAQAA
jgi:hypothetical protein